LQEHHNLVNAKQQMTLKHPIQFISCGYYIQEQQQQAHIEQRLKFTLPA